MDSYRKDPPVSPPRRRRTRPAKPGGGRWRLLERLLMACIAVVLVLTFVYEQSDDEAADHTAFVTQALRSFAGSGASSFLGDSGASRKILPPPTLRTEQLVVSNSWTRTRYVCGHALEPGESQAMNVTVLSSDGGAPDRHPASNTECLALADSHGVLSLISSRVFSADARPANPGGLFRNRSLTQRLLDPEEPHDPLTEPAWIDPSGGTFVRFGATDTIPVTKYSTETCDVPCFVYGRGGSTRQWEGLPYQVARFTMEASEQLFIDHTHFREGILQATTYHGSDFAIPYYKVPPANPSFRQTYHPPDLREIPAVTFDKAIKGGTFLATNCNSKNNREGLVTDLIHATERTNGISGTDFLRIDSLSRCVPHNVHKVPTTTPHGRAVENLALANGRNCTGTKQYCEKLDLMARYLFHFAFENKNVQDYVTEKLWWTLEAGVIPVYFGTPDAKDHWPHPKAAIWVSDFAYPEHRGTRITRYDPKIINATALAQHLWQVANNQTLYESYHAWRTLAPENIQNQNNAALEPSLQDQEQEYKRYYEQFLDKYGFASVHENCRMCRFGYAMRYGWGWNHHTQRLEAPKLPSVSGKHAAATESTTPARAPTVAYDRRSCVDASDRLVHPLKEVWAGDDEEPTNTKEWECQGEGLRHRYVESSRNDAFLRTMRDHDGVTDMEIVRKTKPAKQQPPPQQQQQPRPFSSFRLVTPFARATEAVLVREHTSYYSTNKERPPKGHRSVPRMERGKISMVDANHTLVWIQDETSRIVLVMDAPADVLLPGSSAASAANNYTNSDSDSQWFQPFALVAPGVLEIVLPAELPRLRVRWLVEDADTFAYHTQHLNPQAATPGTLERQVREHGTETYFASTMVDDFLFPVAVGSEPAPALTLLKRAHNPKSAAWHPRRAKRGESDDS